jgi:AraC family transcriptional regulator
MARHFLITSIRLWATIKDEMTPKLPPGHFLGQTLKARDLPGLRLTEAIYSAGLKLPRHSHELAKYCFVLAGSFSEKVGKDERARRPLSLSFQPADTTHEETHSSPGHHFLIEVGAHLLDRARDYSAILDRPVDLTGGMAIPMATQLYEEFCHMDALSPLAIEGVILELLAATSRRELGAEDRRPPRWLEQVTEVLRDRFAENPTLSDLAAAANVHTVHLARVFRKFHGCTVGDYIRQLRIEYASRLLSTTDDSLVEIALAAGFSDQSHFSRTFKSHTRMLPSEFRAIFRPR